MKKKILLLALLAALPALVWAADSLVSNLTADATISGSEELYVNDAGTDKKMTVTQVRSALSASNLTSGTIPDARFPSTLPAANGSALTALNATQLTSGTVPDARFPSALPAVSGNALTTMKTAIHLVVGDETTTITTGTAKLTFRMPYAMTLTAVRASVNTVSSSGLPTVDINEAGSTILSTKLSIDESEKTSTTAATAAVISDTGLADDAEITIDIDVAGTGAKGLKVWLIGTR